MRPTFIAKNISSVLMIVFLNTGVSRAELGVKRLELSRAEYTDRVQAAWTAQIIACLMGFQFEHKVASVQNVDSYPRNIENAPVDDDWYYEMCAVRAFEKYGIDLSVEQLGEQWKENSCGSWGSSEQARLNLAKGIKAPDTGHPRYNKLWFTIGPQFSAKVYGLIAPGMPNLAAELARKYGRVNGYAEGVDGAVFIASMVSMAFVEKDPKAVMREAAQMINTESPYRKMLDQIIDMADSGKSAQQIFNFIEDRWRVEYPASNNAIPNGGIVAVGVLFGEGDFLKTLNLIYAAADFTDADCNAANATAVIAAMHGSKCLPNNLVEPLHNRIVGTEMGRVKLTPPVDEKISDLAERTVAIGEKFIKKNKGLVSGEKLFITEQKLTIQPTEIFSVGDLTQFWNADWKLERAGWGGAGGGIGNLRGNTHLAGDVLATWPRDVARGVVLRRSVKLSKKPVLTFFAGVDPGRAWELEVYANNKHLLRKLIDGTAQKSGELIWETITVNLKDFAGQETQLRLYQGVRLANKIPGNAYWKALELE